MLLKVLAALVPLSIPLLLLLSSSIRKAVATAFVAGLVLAFPGAFFNPLLPPLIELVACDSSARLAVRSAGRGGGHYCVDRQGSAERVFLWSALSSFDLHYVLVGVPAVLFFAVRESRRRGRRVARG